MVHEVSISGQDSLRVLGGKWRMTLQWLVSPEVARDSSAHRRGSSTHQRITEISEVVLVGLQRPVWVPFRRQHCASRILSVLLTSPCKGEALVRRAVCRRSQAAGPRQCHSASHLMIMHAHCENAGRSGLHLLASRKAASLGYAPGRTAPPGGRTTASSLPSSL